MFIAVRNTQTPARLPNGADEPLKRAEVVLKREGMSGGWCAAIFAVHVRGDSVEGERLMVGREVAKELQDF